MVRNAVGILGLYKMIYLTRLTKIGIDFVIRHLEIYATCD